MCQIKWPCPDTTNLLTSFTLLSTIRIKIFLNQPSNFYASRVMCWINYSIPAAFCFYWLFVILSIRLSPVPLSMSLTEGGETQFILWGRWVIFSPLFNKNTQGLKKKPLHVGFTFHSSLSTSPGKVSHIKTEFHSPKIEHILGSSVIKNYTHGNPNYWSALKGSNNAKHPQTLQFCNSSELRRSVTASRGNIEPSVKAHVNFKP